MSRGTTKRRLAKEYEKAHISTLNALDSVREEDMDKQLNYPDWDPLLSGEVSVERLFRYVAVHFQAHERQIRSILEEKNEQA